MKGKASTIASSLTTFLFLSITATSVTGADGVSNSTSNSTIVACHVSAVAVEADLIRFSASAPFRCFLAWESQDFVLMYQNTEPGLWSFLLSAPESEAYVAVGFSPNKGRMVGSSAVVGWSSGEGAGVAKQYYLGGKSSARCPPDRGDLPLVPGGITFLRRSSRLYLAFQLNASVPPATRLIYSVGPRGFRPGSSDYYLQEHREAVSTIVDFATGESVAVRITNRLKTSHWVLAVAGWGVLVPVGILAARYGKQWDPAWYYAHVSVQSAGFALGLAAVVTGFKLERDINVGVGAHKGVGVSVAAFGFLQVMAVLLRPRKTSKIRKYWNWYHHGVGRIAVVCAAANVFYGMSLAEEGRTLRIVYGTYLGAWFLLSLVLEIRMRVRK